MWLTYKLTFISKGHQLTIIDNLSRRKIEKELQVESLTPIATIKQRLQVWEKVSAKKINFYNLDISQDYENLANIISSIKPDIIIHFAEQRAAPYSMKSSKTKRYAVNNNTNATHNVLCAMVEAQTDIHLIHLGTMGVYGYGSFGAKIPEGYLAIHHKNEKGEEFSLEILYPTNPGSIYHLTKSQDQLLFEFYNKNDDLRITDLHQGIVWGTNTRETNAHPKLINRFDYDGDYGTVLNRFLMQAALNLPLTVHGIGGQTRAFIHISDMIQCIDLAIENPPKKGERVKILNQMTETLQIGDLAKMISELTHVPIQYQKNPRKEALNNSLLVENATFLDLGLQPTLLKTELLTEVMETAKKFAHRCDISKIPCTSKW